ncbi:polyprenol phosphomannose-dependent alpha 1,6 mannosyltransferase MptB [Propionicicella superfundia]|uniref:polyprenol phosphomannose-dependent alpha 1,6 mannosyltransferase MptB n=1 Tax=Propionicicella superfundia TaxID=348582 RepID=UPI0004247DED|nr:polyprenol phosphomannose-dependent alpha 1,6 mannosyltransferase MptB [Propionicicella superfundia]
MSATTTLTRAGRAVGRGWRDIATAWSFRPVRLGLLGTVLITLGSLTPAYLPQNSPWWPPLRAMQMDSLWGKALGTILVVAGAALLMEAWFQLRPAVYHFTKHWAILIIWGLPFAFAPPIFSHDAYSYAAQGWLAQNGINPYEYGPGVLPGAFADQVAWVWRYTPAPYGPLSIQVSRLLDMAAGFDPYWAAVSMRIPALVGVALIVLFLPRIAHTMGVDAQEVAWLATINPLLVIDFVGGAHNDALMMGLVVLALWVAMQPAGRWWWARQLLLPAAIVGTAAAIKQPAFLAAYPIALIARPWTSWQPRAVLRAAGVILASCLTAIGTFAAISVATGLNFGWMNAVSVPGLQLSMAPFTLIGAGLQWVLQVLQIAPTGSFALDISRLVGLSIAAVSILFLALTKARKEPVTFLSWSYLIFAFCSPALQSWYLLWGGLLLPLTRPQPRTVRVAIVITVALLCYGAGNLAFRNQVAGIAFGGLALFATLAYRRFRHRRDRTAGSQGGSTPPVQSA